MEEVNPWHSPDDAPKEPPRIASTQWLSVLMSWGAAGALLGTTTGGLLQATSGVAGGASTFGISGIFALAGLGALALWVERRGASSRPALLDARGRPTRPLHGGLFVVPVLVSVPALLLLVVLGSVWLGGPGPAVAFLAAASAVAWAGLRVWSTHRYTVALQDLEEGAVERAREQLARLARAWVVTRSARTAARLNLGMLALHEGSGEEALDWYLGLQGAWAQAGRALALFMLDRTPEAGEELGDALGSPSARHLQEQLDALRVLWVWRTEGPDAARELGTTLLGPTATPLHRALLVALGDRHWRDDREVEALVHSGLGLALPELAAIR